MIIQKIKEIFINNKKLHCFIIGGDISCASNYRPYNLSIALKEKGLNILVICKNIKSNTKFIKNLEDKGINVRTYHKNKIFSLLQTRLILFKLNPIFIYQTNPTLRSFLSLFLTNYQIIGDWDEPDLLKYNNGIRKYLSIFLHRWFLKRCVVKVSCTKYYQKFIPNSFYIPHGQYIKKTYSNFDLQGKKEKYFAYLGNFYSLWDHDLLFEGLLKAKKNGFQPIIKFIGDGPEYTKWINFSKLNNLDNIIFTGFLSHADLMIILKNAHALLFPMRDTPINKSRCPSKIFAYIASKRPVIAHEVGEIKSLLLGKAKLYNPSIDLIDELRTLPENLLDVNYEDEKYSYTLIAEKYIKLIGTIRSNKKI